MRTKFGLLVACAAASLWIGNTTFAQSSQSSTKRGDETSGGMQRPSGQSDQYGSSSGSQGSSAQSGSSSQRGGSSSSGQYGGSSTSQGTTSGQTGSSAGSSSQKGGTTSGGAMQGGTTGSTGATKTSRRGGHDASQELEQHPALSSKLGTMLPAGTSAQDAASGFKNLGEFVAAVHVSQNLNIPFDQLKTKVTSGQSLGDAVKDLKPGVDAKTEIKKARDEVKEDMKTSK